MPSVRIASGGNQDRCEKVHDFVGPRRHNVFLDQHLDPVGDRLEKPEWADAIRAVAILYAAEDFAFHHGDQRKESKKNAQHGANIDEARGDLDHPIGRAGQPGKQPLF